MSEKSKSDIIEMIRKILNRTERNGCTPAEAEAAFAMASRKLAEHNLTMEEVSGGTNGTKESWVDEAVEEMTRWTLEDNLRYNILRRFYFVECVLMPIDRRKVFRIFGTPENVAVARHVWAMLQHSFDRCWTHYRIINRRPASERRLFVKGMADGFTQKMQAERDAQIIERDIVHGGCGTALALASIEDKTIAAFKAHHGPTKTSKSHFSGVTGERSTLEAGREAGRNLNLNKSVAGNRTKAIH